MILALALVSLLAADDATFIKAISANDSAKVHSMLAVEAQGRKPTFAFVLRHGSEGSTLVFEYDASACAFVSVVVANPRDVYLAGWECWATDLIAVLQGELGPIALMYGRARLWNHLPQRFCFDMQEALSRVSHPLSNSALERL